MRQADSTVQNLARLLLIYEAGGSQDLDSQADAMERACDKLRLRLAKLMGADAFTLLLVRALVFTRVDFAWVRLIQAEKDGSLKGLRASAGERTPEEARAGYSAILSHFLELLVTFIGEGLTLRLIQGAWSDVDLGGNELSLEETI